MSETNTRPAYASGTFAIGGQLPVHRLGYGAMQLTGKGIWGPPRDRRECIRVLREAVALGVDFIDTAESYGPHVSEELIAEALHPYPQGLVIATKGGLDRSGPDQWPVNCSPERLREEAEGSLKRLKLETIDLWQLHRVDPKVPLEEQVGVAKELRDEGKIRFFGVSEVSTEQLVRIRELIDVATVQSRFNYVDRAAEDVLEACERDGLGFVPWFPLAAGRLTAAGSLSSALRTRTHPLRLRTLRRLAKAARRQGATPAQLALAWLLRRSPVMLPIPGTSRVAHLRENLQAATIQLSEEELRALA